jgi:DUF4097 and DUF4098 domain-containing protein YvlB
MPHVRIRRSVVRIALLSAAVAGATACDVVINSMEGGRAKAAREWTASYALSGPDARVEVANVNGPIEVEAADGASVEVKAVINARGATDEEANAALKQVEISVEKGQNSVRLEAKYPKELGRRGVSIDYRIRLPKSVKITAGTVNGSITVTGVQSAVRAESTNGNVNGHELAGSVVASTTNGSLRIQMAQLGNDGVTLETTNGSIDLKLPGQAKASVSARCVNGGINVSDLDFEKVGESSRRKLDGHINGGGAAVKLETVNGGIRIGKAG